MNDWVRDIYEEHRGLLFRVAWLILRRADLAEDAVHTAFSRIVSSRPQLNGNAKGYALQAVRNAAIDIQRQRARRKTDTVTEWDNLPGERPSLKSSTEQHDRVAAALERLDAATQEIIHLHIHEGLTFREIAELTDAPLQTVASRYRRGLKQIEARVQRDD